jgi:hypothetical protein
MCFLCACLCVFQCRLADWADRPSWRKQCCCFNYLHVGVPKREQCNTQETEETAGLNTLTAVAKERPSYCSVVIGQSHKNCCTRRFLCGAYHINGECVINYSRNFCLLMMTAGNSANNSLHIAPHEKYSVEACIGCCCNTHFPLMCSVILSG